MVTRSAALVLVLVSALVGCSDDTGSYRPCVEGKRAADEFVRNEINPNHAVKSTDFYLRECKAEAELGG